MLTSSGYNNRKEFATSILATNYLFSKVAIKAKYCRHCFAGGDVHFTHIFNPMSLIPRETQATDTWKKLINDGVVNPTQALTAYTPKTSRCQAHILTDRRILDFKKPGPVCGGVNCAPKCILCFSYLGDSGDKSTICTSFWPNIPVHAKCCAICTFPGCTEMVPALPAYLTQDEVLQRCLVHTESESGTTRVAVAAKPASKPLFVPSKTTSTIPYKASNFKSSAKPPRLTSLQRNPVKGCADISKMMMMAPMEPLELPQPCVKRSRFDFTPPPPTRFDVPEPDDFVMSFLNLSEEETTALVPVPAPSPATLEDLP